MARFDFDFDSGTGADFTFFKENEDVISVDDLLEVMRPAAVKLVAHLRSVVGTRFHRRTGSLADSIDFEDSYSLGKTGYASFLVKPFGRHKGGRRVRKSRAGSADARYAKHNRRPSSTALSNAELGYLLEYGTPRIAATHWMENGVEEIQDELQTIIADNFADLLKRKGLI